MLILGRKVGEEIHLGDDIVIKIAELGKGIVKIGIEAPRDIVVLRGELKEKIKSSNIQANTKVDKKEIKDLSRLLKK